MKIAHVLSEERGHRRALRILLIGCGGNGSAVLFGLPYLHHALIAWGNPWGIDVTVMDADTVSPTNEALNNKTGTWRQIRYWLDLGNNANNGQFVLGQPLNDINRASRTRLRTVTELFPSIMDTTQGEGTLPSCSAAEALERQEPFINNVLASSALAMLTRLLRYGTLDHHGAFYNAVTGRSVPMPIDPELWEKQARRLRRRVKAA